MIRADLPINDRDEILREWSDSKKQARAISGYCRDSLALRLSSGICPKPAPDHSTTARGGFRAAL
jgi:hypothetical protein